MEKTDDLWYMVEAFAGGMITLPVRPGCFLWVHALSPAGSARPYTRLTPGNMPGKKVNIPVKPGVYFYQWT